MTEKKMFANSCESLVMRRAGRRNAMMNGEQQQVRRPLPDLVINTFSSITTTTTANVVGSMTTTQTSRPTSINGCNGLPNLASSSLPSLPSPSEFDDLGSEPGTPLFPPPSPFIIGIKLRRISLNFDESRPARRRSSALF